MQDQNATAMLSLAAARGARNNFLLDGVPITDIFNRAAIIPSIEAVEEVKVQVSIYDAELGRTGGGVFNTTHKSGSNAWHGSALFLNRPQWGTGKLFFTQQERRSEARDVLPSVGRVARRAARQESHVLLGEHRRLQDADDGNRCSRCRPRASAAATIRSPSTSGRLIVIYDPLTTRPDPARPGQFIRDPFPGLPAGSAQSRWR